MVQIRGAQADLPSRTTTWFKFVDNPNQLNHSVEAVGAWYTNPEQPSAEVTVTVAGRVARLPQLVGLCKSWPGPLSVVLIQELESQDNTGRLTLDHKNALRLAALQVHSVWLPSQCVAGVVDARCERLCCRVHTCMADVS